MTTDRTAAPSRSTALADRPASAAGRTPAPPADMFSALLGAATPKKGDQPVRRDDNPANRRDDDHGHVDKQRRSDDAHRAGDKRKPVHQTDDAPPAPDAAETADTATQDANAEQKPTVTIAPNLFALQLTSPLPPQGTPAAETPATAPTLPAFAGQVPASVAAATTAQATLSGTVGAIAATAADATATAATTAADAAAATANTAQGAIALEGLPAEATADTTLPAGIDLTKPQVQAPATDAPAAPAPDAASQSQQNPADAQSQPQPRDTAPAQPAVPAQHTAKPADAPAPSTSQPINTSPIAPNAAPAMPTTPSVQRAVPLSRAVATTGVMVHMMSSNGVEHARLNLKPAELGGIEVRLRSTSAGIHAMLVADSPEAARMLASAGDDLKRQLEDKNVNLLSLDVSTSDQRQDQPAGFSTDGFGDDRYRPGFGQNARRSSADESALLMDAPASAETTLVLPDGVHVDVLA
jgi:flagellar hook-length control protein FliK